MAITGNSSYIPTMNEFLAHWAQCNTALTPAALLVRLMGKNITKTRANFVTLRDLLQSQQNAVQSCLADQQIVRGNLYLQKAALLAQFNEFTAVLDGYYQGTDFYNARPYAPSITDGQEVFTRAMVDMMLLWAKLNAGTAPAGITLPLVLDGGLAQGAFASAVSALQFTYASERDKAQETILARARRNQTQDEAYEIMNSYREAVPYKLAAFPELVETMPRLTPLPGHTPKAVNASAIFQEPNAAKVVYDASNDLMLERYELRGTVGEHYDEEDAVVIATHTPNETREFITTFGLNQPGAEIALKVFVVLTTGNESGSAAMQVQRPMMMQLMAA
jgi:hypothetical protein